MRHILTITRRDLGSLFLSPIGYIFMIVFLVISVGLYMTSFFAFPQADMRAFFSNLPLIFCVFIPAVTMRTWAEERKENTWELLLTFPMRASELVLGKFFAMFLFFAITLAGTVTVPIMLSVLGNPDNGAMLGGYVGSLLLGGFFLSLGIFFSGFCKDQIVAFVVTLLACFAIFLLGTQFIASYLDGFMPGLGSNLGQLVGLIDHFTPFTRGVIDIADVLYFVAWTVLFLVLNILYIDGRNRPGAKTGFAGAVAICVGIGLAANYLISGQSLGRFDMTEDKVYTVSPASAEILSELDAPVQVNVYITPAAKMPTAWRSLEQEITDKLDELRIESGNKLTFTPIYLEAANVITEQAQQFGIDQEEEEEEDAVKSLETRMLDKGVAPFAVQAFDNEEITQKLIYSAIGIAYRDQPEEIIPQVPQQMIPELEYRIINTVYKLSQERPKIALYATKESANIDPQMRQIMMQLGQPVPEERDLYGQVQRLLEFEKYEVERFDFTKESNVPDEYDALSYSARASSMTGSAGKSAGLCRAVRLSSWRRRTTSGTTSRRARASASVSAS